MLEQLVKYAERENLGADPCFECKEVKWTIVLDNEGAFKGIIALGSPEEKRWRGKTFGRVPLTPGNELQSGGKSHFLSETVETVLCLFPEKAKGNKTLEQITQSITEKHHYFVGLIQDALEGGVETFDPIVNFFEDSNELEKAQRSLAENKQLKTTDMMTFDVDGECVLDQTNWYDFWRKKREKPKKEKNSNEGLMACFATGMLAPSIRTHGKIKGIWGGNPTGTALVANDKDAFQSYGLEKSKNAAVSVEAESRYRAGLQALLKNAISLGGVQFIYWTRDKSDLDPVEVLRDPDPFSEDEDIQEGGLRTSLKAIREGGSKPQLDDTNIFYGCALSGNGGRIVVRDWWETALENVFENIVDWFEDLSISKNKDSDTKNPKFYTLLSVLVRKKQGKPQVDDLAKYIPIQLMRAALCRFKLPRAVLDKAIERHIIELREDNVRAERLGLIKAYLNRAGGEKMSKALNENSTNIAYHCGRLFAMFERIQYRALGKVNAGVVQKYYGAASTTPGLVMGRLFLSASKHLGAIDHPVGDQKTIGEITIKIGESFPPSLSLEEQGRFALGYYHQRQANFQ